MHRRRVVDAVEAGIGWTAILSDVAGVVAADDVAGVEQNGAATVGVLLESEGANLVQWNGVQLSLVAAAEDDAPARGDGVPGSAALIGIEDQPAAHEA